MKKIIWSIISILFGLLYLFIIIGKIASFWIIASWSWGWILTPIIILIITFIGILFEDEEQMELFFEKEKERKKQLEKTIHTNIINEHKSPFPRFLHNHPNMELKCELDNDHVIVDKNDWEEIKRTLNLNLYIK